ncbi:MAG: formate dehydrogenase accessory protein FdhE, partial [Proteobacteria bacterium]|nr:formate dehydrogenase accessory protein FdhE [Pseudomonadota bacterium]
MTKLEPPVGGPIDIGEEAKPPFAVLPDLAQLYLKRSDRFSALASNHRLKVYLSFLAGLTRAQHEIVSTLAQLELPSAEAIAQSLAHAMPPIGPASLLSSAAESTFEAFLQALNKVVMPGPAAAAVRDLKAATPVARAALLSRALTGDIAQPDIAELSLASAALQVHASRLAARLDATTLKPIADGICPACGSPPAASAVVGWPGAHNSRYCVCSLCSTHWNVVRVKCVLCSETG